MGNTKSKKCKKQKNPKIYENGEEISMSELMLWKKNKYCIHKNKGIKNWHIHQEVICSYGIDKMLTIIFGDMNEVGCESRDSTIVVCINNYEITRLMMKNSFDGIKIEGKIMVDNNILGYYSGDSIFFIIADIDFNKEDCESIGTYRLDIVKDIDFGEDEWLSSFLTDNEREILENLPYIKIKN